METKRENWGSNLGFILAAVGSAVGLGNIWGFPYKMGKSGGFTFLIYAVMCVACVVFVCRCIVETKGKTLEQIEKEFLG